MDQVLFQLKRAHIESTKWGRRVLADSGLTPARFDVLFALDGAFEVTQVELRRMLGVARATICEMLTVLERLELVVRERARDRRTWLVALTAKGAAMFRRAADATMHNGFVPLVIDAALTRRDAERDSYWERCLLWHHIDELADAFGARMPLLYQADLDLIEGALLDADDPFDELSYVESD